jgi:hypothetical protein
MEVQELQDGKEKEIKSDKAGVRKRKEKMNKRAIGVTTRETIKLLQ